MPSFVKYPIICFLLLFIQSRDIFGQNSPEVPLDPRVKLGQLENGLTYYLQSHPKPANKVELRLVVNAGSVLEEEGEEGVAHFLEHMAFNGTRNFPKNELVSYLQSIGVAFGPDLNAYTGFDETVYILPVPTGKKGNLETGFEVLRDWADGILIDTEEVDAERNIILEEWRTGQGYSERLQEQYLPQLLYQSKYANRLPIGKMETVKTVTDQTIRAFYERWYRPDNMALIAVGDYDVDSLEMMVYAYFNDFENPTNPIPREKFKVPEHEQTFIDILTDKEAPGIQLQLFYKHPPLPTKTEADYRNYLIRLMYAGMLSQRLDEIRQQEDAPFIFAGMGYGNFVRSMDYFSASAVVAKEKVEMGLQSLLAENKRVAQYGFIQPELDRIKRALLNNAERAYTEREKVESRAIAGRYVNHFLNNRFAEGEVWKYEFYQKLIPDISLEEINALADYLVRDESRVVIITAPENEAEYLPGQHEVIALLNKQNEWQILPYSERELSDRWVSELTPRGKVESIQEISEIGTYEISLSNGAKVFVKPTDFKNDEIVFSLRSLGGTSLSEDEFHHSAAYAGVLVNVMGLGEFSPTDLRKMMAGKTVSVTPNIGTYNQQMTGYTSPKFLENCMELIHLNFTSPRIDKGLFEVYIQNQKQQLSSAQSNPDYLFSKYLNRILSDNHPRASGFYEPDELGKIDMERAIEIYRERFANAGNFEFFFTGNIDMEQFIDLLEIYIGSLPGNKAEPSNFRDLGIRAPQDRKEDIFVGQDEKSQVLMYFSGDAEYVRENALELAYLGEILTNKLIERLREEMGGVYGVGASGSMGIFPVPNFSFSVGFPCSPEEVDNLIAAVWEEIERIKNEGPKPEDLEKVKEKRRISLAENREKNSYWNSQLSYIRSHGLSWGILTNGAQSIEAINEEKIKNIANRFLRPEYLLEVRRFPERMKASVE